MDVKLVLVIIVLLTLAGNMVDADILYNRMHPKLEDLKDLGLKCIPGRTSIKMGKKESGIYPPAVRSGESARRTHMNSHLKEEECLICICSVDGKEEECIGRPARNVNECIQMSMLTEEMNRGIPYSHDRTLAYRIRRDYIWHNDEIPYNSKAKCRRGTSYYTNNIQANDTSISALSDVDSLLSYKTKDVCFYCVCSVHGENVGCISKDPWYCEYYRMMGHSEYPRNRYASILKQDRPAYFRNLSYRLRRRKDDGIYALLDIVGNDLKGSKCIPFVSEYTDCSDANMCSGCTRCTCDRDGNWACKKVIQCPVDDEEDTGDEISLDVALNTLLAELQEKKKNQRVVPGPPKIDNDLVLDKNKFEDSINNFMSRKKRSLDGGHINKNHTIKFYNTVDEINEDTLKSLNKTGTVEAHKFTLKVIPKLSRRTSFKDNKNRPGINPFHVELNQREKYNHYSTENKTDSVDKKKTKVLNKNILKILGNYTQDKKDTDISKLVVNELKSGVEVIGGKDVNPVSNITFTPENDTLTAMAFIAGNLLNKLWDMEKYAGYESIEGDTLKHEKINDLLDLFKEPLSIRQETFLKNALDKLSESLDRNKNAKNVSICETFAEKDIINKDKNGYKNASEKTKYIEATETTIERDVSPSNVTSDVLSKLNNILNLTNNFEMIQKNIDSLKGKPQVPNFANNKIMPPTDTIKVFGNILNKISKLLIPNSYQTTKDKIKNLHYLDDRRNQRKLSLDELNINDVNMTIKDKIVLDYIRHIENNPSCLYKNKLQTEANESLFKIEGSILYNLSEFLKIKSFEDFVKLSKADANKEVLKKIPTTTEKNVLRVTNEKNLSKKERNKLQIVKEKLKKHLKAIIDDLVELQGKNSNDNETKKINIAQALPCIYNILNEKGLLHNKTSNKIKTSSLNKIKSLIDSLKLDLQTNSATRRKLASSVSSPSVKIFERVIRNIDRLLKQRTRRNFNEIKPKTFDQIKNMINRVKKSGNSYKNFALLSKVSPKNRVMLLKTLEADVKLHERVMTNIKSSIDIISNLPQDKILEMKEFVEKSIKNIDLSEMVFKNILKNKEPNKQSFVEEFEVEKDDENLSNKRTKLENLLSSDDRSKYLMDTAFKVTREQIINQLMVNHVNAYLRRKEATETNLNDDLKYNVAVNILSLMKSGNTELAKELFEILISTNREMVEKPDNVVRVDQKPEFRSSERKMPLIVALKEPLITIEEQKDTAKQEQDNLIKQLMNLESMNK